MSVPFGTYFNMASLLFYKANADSGVCRKGIAMEFLEVGKIINTHGLRGEVKVVTWTDSPDVFETLKSVAAKTRAGDITLSIKGVKYQKNNIIVKFAEIDSVEEAEKLKNAVLSASRDELGELPEGVYYIADLVGCEVFDENGKIGVLSDVFTAGASDVYDIKRDGKKNILVPIIDGVLKNVDIGGKRIDIKIPEGLEDE